MSSTRQSNLDRMAACWRAALDLGFVTSDVDPSASLIRETPSGAAILSVTDDEVGLRLTLQEWAPNPIAPGGRVLVTTGYVDTSNLSLAQFTAVLHVLTPTH